MEWGRYCFHRCLSVHSSGGVPPSHWWGLPPSFLRGGTPIFLMRGTSFVLKGGTPSQVRIRGYPHSRSGWQYPHPSQWGYSHPSQQEVWHPSWHGIPQLRSRWGEPLSQVRTGVPPSEVSMGYPHPWSGGGSAGYPQPEQHNMCCLRSGRYASRVHFLVTYFNCLWSKALLKKTLTERCTNILIYLFLSGK